MSNSKAPDVSVRQNFGIAAEPDRTAGTITITDPNTGRRVVKKLDDPKPKPSKP